MKNIINGVAAALFVAFFLFFSIALSSCGGPQAVEAKSLGSTDSSGNPSKPKVVVSCLNNNCGSFVLQGTPDTSTGPHTPKFVVSGRTTVAIPANTEIDVEIRTGDDSAYVAKNGGVK